MEIVRKKSKEKSWWKENKLKYVTKKTKYELEKYWFLNSHLWKQKLDHEQKKRRKTLDAFELRVRRKILSIVIRKETKQNFAESETKHFVRCPDKNAENTIFWTRNEDTSILGE